MEESGTKNNFEPIDDFYSDGLYWGKIKTEDLSDDECNLAVVKYEKIFQNEDLWETIGFIRPLGGLFYNFVLAIVGALIALVFIGFLISWLYPYPEAQGYYSIVQIYFRLMFSIFDIGTAYGIERYIAEYRIKDPKKMVTYLQFFIWYQMMTGLIQTTIVSIYAIFYLPYTNQAYSIWLFLILSTTQYPGFLGFFKASLKGLQHFNKAAILDFFGAYVFQQATNVIFILLGRYLGGKNPAIGELMGMAIGGAIGLYIDDFFATALSIYFFNKTIKVFGFTWISAFGFDFTKQQAWECTKFGVKVALGPLWGTAVGFIINIYWITYIPQFATFATISSVARGVADVMKFGEGINLIPAISESFLNDKNKLAQFYIAQTFKYWTFFSVPMMFVIAAFIPVILKSALSIEGTETYALAASFILPWMIFNIQENVTHTADNIIVGASRPNFLMMTRLVEETLKLLFMTLWIVWLQLPQTYGITAIAWVMAMGIWPAVIIKTLAGWWFINTKIVKVKVPLGQTFFAPISASLVMYILSIIYLNTIHRLIEGWLGILPAGIIALLIAFIVMFAIVYLTFYGIFGGFDDFGLDVFSKAVKMSGPSKGLMGVVEFFLRKGIKISKLHNKFPIPSKFAEIQAYELMYQRMKADERL